MNTKPELKLQAIISGALVADPQTTTTAAGKPCVKASLQLDGQRIFLTAMHEVADELATLKAGDGLSVAGRITISPSEYNGQPSLTASMFVTRVLPLAEPKKKREQLPESKQSEDDREPFAPEAGNLDNVGAFRGMRL